MEIGLKETELEIVPHWSGNEYYCSFYVFHEGREAGTVISTDINEWAWLTKPGPEWLAQYIGNEID
ncbi:hypothetical protein [Mucilaginibacter pedocola]|uniref:hypothetical protein n=1 Tax=Mucilaginibacter pedocola TaxID=1792845 RepID=UPI00138FFFF4|nr:hypothetical protein [Mucilaginibacter pedocola]